MNEYGVEDETLQNSELVFKPLEKAWLIFSVSYILIVWISLIWYCVKSVEWENKDILNWVRSDVPMNALLRSNT